MAAATNGRLDLAALERLVADGQIDTVLSTFPDMQGRLMGKRLTARFFLDHVASEGIACLFLSSGHRCRDEYAAGIHHDQLADRLS